MYDLGVEYTFVEGTEEHLDNYWLHSPTGFCEPKLNKNQMFQLAIGNKEKGSWKFTHIIWQKARTPADMTGDSWVTKFSIVDVPAGSPRTNYYNDDEEFETGIKKEDPVDKVRFFRLPHSIDWQAIFLNMKGEYGTLRQGRVDAVLKAPRSVGANDYGKIQRLFYD